MTSRKRSHRSHHRDSKETDVIPFWEDRAGVSPVAFVLACAVFATGLLFGGTGGSFGDTIVQLLALPLIVLAALQWNQSKLQAPDWMALGLLAGIVTIAFVQLVPLPASLWASLPARADLMRDLHNIGAAPAWTSISLNPYATERALLWTLPAVAMFLTVRWMSPRQSWVLLLMLFLGALVLLLLRLALSTDQPGEVVATANESLAKATLALNLAPLPVPKQDPEPYIAGLFSNHNHFATFLAMTIPLIMGAGLRIWSEHKKGQSEDWVRSATLLILALFGLLAAMIQTHSRAALVLGGIAIVGSLMLLRQMRLNRKIIWFVVICTGFMVAIVINTVASPALAKLDTTTGIDVRWQIHATTLKAAHMFGPLGSGLGTFVEAYQQVQPEEGFLPVYINRAHSDYHELWLETGMPGAVLIVAFLGWFGWSSWRVWSGPGQPTPTTLISRAASLSIVMVLLHSYVDYPLRKTAILVVFGMACGFLKSTEVAVKSIGSKPTETTIPKSAT